MRKEISLMQVRYDYEIVSRQSDEITARRAIIRDMRENYPGIEGVAFEELMNLDLD
jgi:hypothetical protein